MSQPYRDQQIVQTSSMHFIWADVSGVQGYASKLVHISDLSNIKSKMLPSLVSQHQTTMLSVAGEDVARPGATSCNEDGEMGILLSGMG